MKSMKFLSLLLVLLFLAVSTSLPTVACAKSGDEPKHDKSVVIYRDIHYGVPHIYADTTYGLYYGYGYSIATDRLFQMEMIKRTVLGTVAEVLGSTWVTYDKGVHSNYTPAIIQQEYQALDHRHKDVFEGYAAGMNARINEVLKNQATLLPKQFTDYGFQPTADWTGLDVVMIFVGTVCFRYSDFPVGLSNLTLLNNLLAVHSNSEDAWNIFNQLEWINDPGAPTTIPARENLTERLPKKDYKQTAGYNLNYQNHLPPMRTAEANRAYEEKELLSSIGLSALAEPPSTSNLWVLGKKKTYDGGSIFQNGPQFGWFNPGYVYEVGLHGAGFDLVGNSPFGYPAIFFGHNQDITWGSTAGLGALVDIYEEQLCSTNPHANQVYGYLFNGQCLDMDMRTDTINVKGGNPVSVNVYRTVHGLVVQFGPPPGVAPYNYAVSSPPPGGSTGVAYSKKRSWEGYELQSLIGWIESMKAEDFSQWRDGASKMAITINWYYADRGGNIGYIHNGKYPVRPECQDFRLPASGTGNCEWQGILPFKKNPQDYNPKQGYFYNWNNKPRIDWVGSSWSSADRVQVIIDELEAKHKFTKEDAWDINKRISFIDVNLAYFLPFLKQAVKGLPTSDPNYQAVLRVKAWDGYRKDLNHDGYYDDPGQTIFQTWLGSMLQETFATTYNDLGASRPSFLATGYPTTPPAGSTNIQQGTRVLYHALLGKKSTIPNNYDFFHGVKPLTVVLKAVGDTTAALTTKYGPDMSKWLLPVVQQEFFPTNFVGVPQADASEALFLPISMNRGTENHLIVLNRNGVEGEDVCPPGQSGFVAPNGTLSSHYSDQMDLYKNFELKPMLFDFHDVVKNSGPPQILHY
jgi:penicillin amidase